MSEAQLEELSQEAKSISGSPKRNEYQKSQCGSQRYSRKTASKA